MRSDVEAFVHAHRSHGDLFADVGAATVNGYRLEVRCHCGVVFGRWVTPEDAAVEMAAARSMELTSPAG